LKERYRREKEEGRRDLERKRMQRKRRGDFERKRMEAVHKRFGEN